MARTTGQRETLDMKLTYKPKSEPMRVAVFMSGSGTNAKRIIESQSGYKVVLIFTDKRTSNAEQISKQYDVPFKCNDIAKFYSSRKKERGDMDVRKEYDNETVKLLEEHKVDVVALCGYMRIVTEPIFENYFTLNVHPADLSIENDGKRIFTGAHAVKDAIKAGQKEIRATVHLVTKDCDQGPIIMISDPVAVESDESKADIFQEQLKEQGDWVIFPQTIRLIAEGRVQVDGSEVYIDEKKKDKYHYNEFVEDTIGLKKSVREEYLKKRKSLSKEAVDEKSRAIKDQLINTVDYIRAKKVLIYYSIYNEVSTEELLKEVLNEKTVLLPFTDLEKNEMGAAKLEFYNELEKGAFGVLEPKNKTPVKLDEIDLVIVPGVAFDERCNRIGYGKNFYDRFLKKINAKRIAFAFEEQIAVIIPTLNHDAHMDSIITEKRIIKNEVRKN
ncbi:MAG: 5-formyltetrahydrofolate cyclo-ligase [bacterium]|nr:5-formyltetrahydrofolate cyclo-ligase [bacterium]